MQPAGSHINSSALQMRTRRIFVTILLIMSFLFAKSQSLISKGDLYNPFDTLKYDNIVIYKRTFEKKFNKNITVINNKINRQVIDTGILLSFNDKKHFIKLITDTSTYGNDIPECYIPEYSFVFYLDTNIVCYVDISLSCNQLNSSIYIPAIDYYNYPVGIDKEGKIIIPMTGFSIKGYSRIKQLCYKYFPH